MFLALLLEFSFFNYKKKNSRKMGENMHKEEESSQFHLPEATTH